MHKKKWHQLIWLCLLWFSDLAHAEDVRFRGDLYLSTGLTQVKEKEPLNLGNRVLEIPKQLSTLEFRPDLKWQAHAEHFFVLRSSHDYRLGKIDYSMPTADKTISEGKTDLTDFFLSSDWGPYVGTVIGLQNYQWGPGEFYSPSNPFFHFQSEQKKFFYKEKGKVLARLNLSFSQHFNVVGLVEFMDNREAVWMAEQEFESKAAVKFDYQFENPINSLSILVGKGDQQIYFVGAHGTYSPVDGASVYFDGKVTQRRIIYLPTKNVFGLYDMEKIEDHMTDPLILIGTRFEGRVDFRQEFLFHEGGYSDDEWRLAKKSAQTLSPYLEKNISRFYKPGLELKRKAYAYSSLRIPNLGSQDQATIFLRLISSMSENSQLGQLSYEHNLTESMVGSLEYSKSYGAEQTEFHLVTDEQFSAGLRYAF